MAPDRPDRIYRLLVSICIGPVIAHLILSILMPNKSRAKQIPVTDPIFGQVLEQKNTPTVHYSTNISITFAFAPFCSDKELKQFGKTSIPSWLQTSNNSKLLVFENTKPTKKDIWKLLKPFRSHLVFGPDLETDEEDLPYVDDWILKSYESSNTDLICFIMPDAILPSDFGEKVSALVEFFSDTSQFAVVGRRCPVIYRENVSLDDLVDEYIHEYRLDRMSEISNAEYSHDFILFSKNRLDLNLDDIPPFHMGRQIWDAWVVGWASEQIPVVSTGGRCGSYHMAHARNTYGRDTAKLSENFQMAHNRGEKAGFASKMKLRIENNSLINGSTRITLFDKK